MGFPSRRFFLFTATISARNLPFLGESLTLNLFRIPFCFHKGDNAMVLSREKMVYSEQRENDIRTEAFYDPETDEFAVLKTKKGIRGDGAGESNAGYETLFRAIKTGL